MIDRLKTLNRVQLVFLEIQQRFGFSKPLKAECSQLKVGRCAQIEDIDSSGLIATRCQHCNALTDDADLIAKNHAVRLRKELAMPDEVTIRAISGNTVKTIIYDGHPPNNNERIVCVVTPFKDPKRQNDVSNLLSS